MSVVVHDEAGITPSEVASSHLALETIGDHAASSDYSFQAGGLVAGTTETAILPGDVAIHDKGAVTFENDDISLHEIGQEEHTSTKSKALATVALALGMLLSTLDATMVATALNSIVQDLHSEELYSWVVTSYLLTSTALQPLWGKFGDLLGRKNCIMFGTVVFTLASVICALAPNMITLIIGRAIQGVGGGCIQSLSFVLVAEVVSLRERGKYQGIMAGIAGIAAIVGPVIGGACAGSETLTWRFAFWMNLIFFPFVFFGYFFFLKSPPKGSIDFKVQLTRIDYLGAVLCTAGVTVFLIGLTWGGTTYPWASAAVICSLVIGLLTLGGFVGWEAFGAKEPAVPTELFRIRNFSLACIALFFVGLCMFAVRYFRWRLMRLGHVLLSFVLSNCSERVPRRSWCPAHSLAGCIDSLKFDLWHHYFKDGPLHHFPSNWHFVDWTWLWVFLVFGRRQSLVVANCPVDHYWCWIWNVFV